MSRIPSGDGGVFAPPGNARVGPVVRRIFCASASIAVAGPLIPNETAPTQLQWPASPFGNGPAVHAIDVSGAARSNDGDSILSRGVNGCASSPGGAFRAPRLSRYSGTRISTFLRNTVRVPAARGP